jgi:VIT1/CCC1 family predicted Fe2+/Mn2+ transporter
MRAFISRYLEPLDALTEIIYGLLIVMTFTMAFRAFDAASLAGESAAVAEAGVQRLLIAAFGCTVAWGLIDGAIYVMTSLAERAERQRLVKLIQAAPDNGAATHAIAEELDDTVGPLASDAGRKQLYADVLDHLRDEPLKHEGIQREDVFGAIALVLLAIVATLPVVIPFLFVTNPAAAIRTSNLIAIVMLFIAGYRWAKYARAKPLKIGLLTAGIGVVLVLVAIPLGG